MKKLLSTAMALVLIIGLLTGCSVESQGEKTESVSNQYYLYYLNKDETKVTKTRYYPEQESAEFMLFVRRAGTALQTLRLRRAGSS